MSVIPATSRVCPFMLRVEMINRYFPFVFWTSIISFCIAKTFFGMLNTPSIQTRSLDYSNIGWGGSTLLLIISNSSHVHARAYSLFDNIPRRASFSFGHSRLPIHNTHSLSGVNLLPLSPWEKKGIIHLSQGRGIGTARAIALPLRSSPASVIHPFDKRIGFTFRVKYS